LLRSPLRLFDSELVRRVDRQHDHQSRRSHRRRADDALHHRAARPPDRAATLPADFDDRFDRQFEIFDFAHAVAETRRRGAERLTILADPNAPQRNSD
jgi:hypothetical protein